VTLPALIECFGRSEMLAQIQAAKIDIDSVFATGEWASAVADSPLTLLSDCTAAHATAWRSIDTFSAALAVFLFEWHKLDCLSYSTLCIFFKLRPKYKLAWLRAIRRSTAQFRKSMKEREHFLDYSHSVKTSTDLLFMATLGIRFDSASFITCFIENRYGLDPLELAYCHSQCKQPLIGYRQINLRLIEAGVQKIAPKFTNSILDFYSHVIRTASGLQPSQNIGMVSVILTTRNPVPELIQAAIDSIQVQDYPSIEIIIVDDASTAAIPINFSTHAGRSIRVIRNSESVGPYTSRNKAIALSIGRFIAFQDDDDVSHPQRLSLQLHRLIQTKCKLLTSQHIRFDENSRLQMDLETSFLSDGPVTTVMERATFDELGGFKQVRSRGDVEYRARCISRFGLSAYYVINAPLYYALGKSDTLSSSYESTDYFRLRVQRMQMNNL
jgi:hypothetical protein